MEVILISILDFILKNILVTIVVISIIFFKIIIRIEEKTSPNLANLLVILWFIFTVIFISTGALYKYHRENGLEASYINIFITFDFTVASLISLTPFFLLYTYHFFTATKITNNLFFSNSSDNTGSMVLSFLITLLVGFAVYGLSAFGNCFYFDIYGYGQKVFFSR
ncbi:MAG: hypothetical protein UZ14_CFX002001921 [Chloroflexi bacterium OLB14]|nr:MAG: hypothetical protein UZ14_CFX002001921 [Chloroflexi bacterium OLB14]